MAVYLVQLDDNVAIPIGIGERITVFRDTEEQGMQCIFEDGGA